MLYIYTLSYLISPYWNTYSVFTILYYCTIVYWTKYILYLETAQLFTHIMREGLIVFFLTLHSFHLLFLYVSEECLSQTLINSHLTAMLISQHAASHIPWDRLTIIFGFRCHLLQLLWAKDPVYVNKLLN